MTTTIAPPLERGRAFHLASRLVVLGVAAEIGLTIDELGVQAAEAGVVGGIQPGRARADDGQIVEVV